LRKGLVLKEDCLILYIRKGVAINRAKEQARMAEKARVAVNASGRECKAALNVPK